MHTTEAPTTETTVTISAGNVEYDFADAATPIAELIEMLQVLEREGATHVVGLSGNYRGPRYVKLGLPEWTDDDEFD